MIYLYICLQILFINCIRFFDLRRIEQFHFYWHLQMRLLLMLHLIPRVALPTVAYPGLLIFSPFRAIIYAKIDGLSFKIIELSN